VLAANPSFARGTTLPSDFVLAVAPSPKDQISSPSVVLNVWNEDFLARVAATGNEEGLGAVALFL
jgi:hypothetical protein